MVAHARASLEGFGISGSAGAGVIVARAGRITLRDGTVRGNAIGLNLLGAEASPDVLGERVYVFGNGIDASRSELPLPDPVQALGDLRRPDLLPKPSH